MTLLQWSNRHRIANVAVVAVSLIMAREFYEVTVGLWISRPASPSAALVLKSLLLGVLTVPILAAVTQVAVWITRCFGADEEDSAS